MKSKIVKDRAKWLADKYLEWYVYVCIERDGLGSFQIVLDLNLIASNFYDESPWSKSLDAICYLEIICTKKKIIWFRGSWPNINN